MFLAGGPFGRQLGHGGGTPMSGISALIRRNMQDDPPLHYVRAQRNNSCLSTGRGPLQNLTTLVPWTQPPKLQINVYRLSCPVCGFLLQ